MQIKSQYFYFLLNVFVTFSPPHLFDFDIQVNHTKCIHRTLIPSKKKQIGLMQK